MADTRKKGEDGDGTAMENMGRYGEIILWYHLVMTNIAMENPNHKWRFLAGKIIYFYGPLSMAMLNNQRVIIYNVWNSFYRISLITDMNWNIHCEYPPSIWMFFLQRDIHWFTVDSQKKTSRPKPRGHWPMIGRLRKWSEEVAPLRNPYALCMVYLPTFGWFCSGKCW
jgi:hypothetical protein